MAIGDFDTLNKFFCHQNRQKAHPGANPRHPHCKNLSMHFCCRWRREKGKERKGKIHKVTSRLYISIMGSRPRWTDFHLSLSYNKNQHECFMSALATLLVSQTDRQTDRDREILRWNENVNWRPFAAAFHSGRTVGNRHSCQNLHSRRQCQNCRHTEGLCWRSWQRRDVSDCKRPCYQWDTHRPRRPLHQWWPSCLGPRPTHRSDMTMD